MTTQKTNLDPLISSPDSNEYFNSISHLIGAILSISALTVLVSQAAIADKPIHVVGFAIYGVSLFLSFLFSCLLHFFLLFGKYLRVFGILDHNAIYILIAGTYTPFCLTIFSGATGWVLFGVIWSLAVFFITLKSIFFTKISVLMSNISFLLMGWIIVFLIGPIYTQLGMGAISLLITGGLFYTVGALIFAYGKPNPFPPYFGNHEIWHLCVLAGNATFFFVMLFYVLPFPTS
ncbi:MAG TPA: hemolysin III family protein [Anaerolineales bacterium]|nr:hemolysin III family protein [Anaerolineales bacterium]